MRIVNRKTRYERFYANLEQLIGYSAVTFCEHVESKKLVSEGYMPLSMQSLPWQHPDDSQEHPCISLCHYGESNGDLMRDPEVIFRLRHDSKEAVPCYYRNDWIGLEQMIPYGLRSKSLDSFCDTWFVNLREQGFKAEKIFTEPLAENHNKV